MGSSEEAEVFAYSPEYQLKVLAYMLQNPEFCSLAAASVQPENFSDRVMQWYFHRLTGVLVDDKHHTKVTLKEELLKAAKSKEIKEDDVPAFLKAFRLVETPPIPVEAEHIRDTLGSFVRTQNVKKAILGSLDLMERGEWGDLADTVQEATTSGFSVMDMGQDYYGEYLERLRRRANSEIQRRYATGIPDLDQMLTGGLRNKQLGIVAGGTGRGKSIFLEWIAKQAVITGHKVIYFTLELSEDAVAERFDSMISKVQLHELEAYDKKVEDAVALNSKAYGSSLIIKEYPEDSAEVGTLEAFYRQLSAQGIVADMIIVDYLDLLKPHRIYGDPTHEVDAITKALRGLSKKLDVPIWTATQLNRGGIVMETPDESSIAGAVSKWFTCDVGLMLAQTKEEREDDEMRIIVSKNRNGMAGRAITILTDYRYFTFFRGSVAPDEDDDD